MHKPGRDTHGASLWLHRLSTGASERAALAARWASVGLLESAELERAAQFKDERARAQFLSGRALVRQALFDHFGLTPNQASFTRSVSGKPEIAGRPDLHFNLSHSHELVVCALARQAIGIDVDLLAREVNPLALAQAYFSPDEVAWITRRGRPSLARFMALWVLKEAYLKALGCGLTVALDSIEFSHVKPHRCVITMPNSAVWQAWWAMPCKGYMLALCCQQVPILNAIRWWTGVDPEATRSQWPQRFVAVNRHA